MTRVLYASHRDSWGLTNLDDLTLNLIASHRDHELTVKDLDEMSNSIDDGGLYINQDAEFVVINFQQLIEAIEKKGDYSVTYTRRTNLPVPANYPKTDPTDPPNRHHEDDFAGKITIDGADRR